ncbi:conserved hypothetical protein [Ricinus communis]|uniref:Uncharacterized protein n=1 Tax=Ricinus communis TaxID=3988 RepID=B9SFP6_RICCO|nr:conserved hypothetical protein [Ricinus communis]
MDHDGPQECCQMRKVNPGGKKCSCPGPRVDIPVVLRISSLVQNPVSNVDCAKDMLEWKCPSSLGMSSQLLLTQIEALPFLISSLNTLFL